MGKTFFKSSASIKKPIVVFAPDAIQIFLAKLESEGLTPVYNPLLNLPSAGQFLPDSPMVLATANVSIITSGTVYDVAVHTEIPTDNFAPFTANKNYVGYDGMLSFLTDWGNFIKGIDNITTDVIGDGNTSISISVIAQLLATTVMLDQFSVTP